MNRRFRLRARVGELYHLLANSLLVGLIVGCGTTVRKSGQVEKFQIDLDSTNLLVQAHSTGDRLPGNNTTRTNFVGNWGDRIRFSTDVVTIQVHSVFLDDLPKTLTGSHDIVVFAEVWESAAADNETPLTKVVYNGRNQMVPGRLNFDGNLAYGPTLFKGHPIKVRFTIMILQKQRGASASTVPDVISKYTASIPVYGVFVSQAAGIIRDVLRAQPDVISFDYETTLLSDSPEQLSKTLNGPAPSQDSPSTGGTKSTGGGSTVKPVKPVPPPRSPSFDDRFGWLQYGFYAIVETAPRTNTLVALSQGSPKEPVPAQPSAPAPSEIKPFDTSKRYFYDRGWVSEYTPSAVSGNGLGTNRLGGKYIVFSITPKQLSESDSTLISASQASTATLQNLRQTQDNVNAALNTVNQGADLMGQAIINAKGNSIAEQLAKQGGITPEQFNREFQGQWQSLTSGLGSYWTSSDKADELKGIQQGILNRYQQVFNSLGITNTAQPNELIVRALDLASNSVAAASQARLYGVQSSTNYDAVTELQSGLVIKLGSVSNDVASAQQILSQVRTNLEAMQNWGPDTNGNGKIQNDALKKRLYENYMNITNALARIGQIVTEHDGDPTTNLAALITLAADCVRFAELSQRSSSDAVSMAAEASKFFNDGRSSAADALRAADTPTKINNANALMASLADAFTQISNASKSAADAASNSVDVKLQSDKSMASATSMVFDSMRLAKMVDTIKESYTEGKKLGEQATKELPGN